MVRDRAERLSPDGTGSELSLRFRGQERFDKDAFDRLKRCRWEV
jgi:hypothetical protein